MIWVGEKGRNVYSTWDMSAEGQKKLDKYYENFEAYVKPKSNQVFSSYKFQCRLQKTNKTCEEFVTDLKVWVKDCQYANPDRMVRDGIVFGTKSSKVREKLINEGSELTLEKALDIARTYELSQRQLQTIKIGEDPNVNSINRKKYIQNKLQTTVIRTNMNNVVNLNINKTNQNYTYVRGVVMTITQEVIAQPKVNNAKSVTKKIILLKCAKPERKKSKPDSRLKSFSGHNIECDGRITLPVTLKNQKHEVEFYVANTKSQSVLGAATCSEVGLIKRVYTLEAKYSDLFTGLGCLPGIHTIHIDDSSTPEVHHQGRCQFH
ncbi:unnamed protein product [Mytilus coruscus]|uniref:Retrotransposon gag domain-containing protein n=1 Tax=Mytilus coruscus TaxID=42192 RepID=A0A6J8A2M4_MYTCO|nr:unnamed protein product [Mytilus coruscus]